MKIKKRLFIGFGVVILVFTSFSSLQTFAQENNSEATEESGQFMSPRGTVLPETSVESTLQCQRVMIEVRKNSKNIKLKVFDGREKFTIIGIELTESDIMGCGIKTGDIPLWMIPYYIRYILEFLIGIAGIIAVLGIVVGGYLYMVSGLVDQKERGKNAIIYSIVGFSITLVAWALVNIIVAFLTG